MLWILVSSRTERERFAHRGGPLELGRGPQRDVPRRVLSDPTVSTNQLYLEPQAEHTVLLRNLSAKVTIRLADGTLIDPGRELSASLPARLQIGDTLIEIEAKDPDESAVDGAALKTIRAPLLAGFVERTMAPQLSDAPESEEMARWFEALIGVQRAAASSPDYFAQTARAVVDLIGLDCGLVLLRHQDDWDPVACHPPHDDAKSQFSRLILQTVVSQRRTFYQVGQFQAIAASLLGVTAVVASPILDESQEVIGAVYGTRRGAGTALEIRPLEAQLTQVLAAAVAAGLARQQSEAQAARRRVQFEQFFTPDLAAALDGDPALLDGRDREVTVLFADIRGFSALSESISPRLVCELIRDVMQHLTARIMESYGVVVDYIGDGLLAMWNAPLDQPDHAALACRAALAMRDGLPELNRRWEGRLGKPIGLGVGINSGAALVGNTGSHQKFKYGPLGHTVNLASRVEGATKHLGVSLLLTGSTRDSLGGSFATRRLCRARVVGISGDVELHELHAQTASPEWLSRRESYERALALYEAGKWSEAAQTVFPILTGGSGGYDLPGLTLLGRAVECLKSPPASFDPVLELKSK
jgi:adenylate cyclase